MRDSQSLLEQLLSFVGTKLTVDHVHAMFGTAKSDRIRAIIDRLIDRDSLGALQELQTTLDQGVDAGQLAEQLVTSLRDIMVLSVDGDPNLLLFHSPSEAVELRQQSSRWGLETILAATQILDQAVTRMRHSVHSRVLLEVALVRVTRLENLDLLSDVISKISAGQVDLTIQAAEPKKKEPEPGIIQRIDSAEHNLKPHSSPLGQVEGESIRAEVATTSRTSSEAQPLMSPKPTTARLTADNLDSIWRVALSKLDDFTADYASHAHSIAISGPNRLAIQFLERYNLSKTSCERPDRRLLLEQTLADIVGVPVKLEFSTLSIEEPQPTNQSAVSPQRKRRILASHPMVECAVNLFQAEITRIDGADG
jgi:DNA polymerase-3 subunit gamma/tau